MTSGGSNQSATSANNPLNQHANSPAGGAPANMAGGASNNANSNNPMMRRGGEAGANQANQGAQMNNQAAARGGNPAGQRNAFSGNNNAMGRGGAQAAMHNRNPNAFHGPNRNANANWAAQHARGANARYAAHGWAHPARANYHVRGYREVFHGYHRAWHDRGWYASHYDRVVVFGGGPIGCLIALVARHRGARVLVLEVNPFRIDLLKGFGLEVFRPDPGAAGRDVVRTVEDWTGGDGADVAFEVTGNAAAVRLITEVVRVWGAISVVAIHAEPMLVNLYPMFARELTMHGSRLYARSDWEEAIRLASTGAVSVGPLVSRRIPLEDLQKGMEEALAGGPVMKVLVDLG